MTSANSNGKNPARSITLFLCGDVMTGRGIDQVLPHPGNPRIHEPFARNARQYVDIAEEANGPIPGPVGFLYIWGDALAELKRMSPDARIINLETTITTSDDYWPGKGIHYRMHPENLPCIIAAGIDCCAVANNHILDWGYKGLAETTKILHEAGLHVAGAGHDRQEAQTPGLMEISGKGRVVVFALGSESSGIPYKWAAGPDKSGINMLPDLTDKTVERIAEDISLARRPGDIIVASIHWGGNWGYEIPDEHINFAHELIDKADVDVIHGHSSHHFLGIEIYKNKPVIYGCGDFLNDYEGIGGNEEYRSDLALMYFVRMDAATGKLMDLEMVPMQIRHFRLNCVSSDDIKWILDRLNRECNKLGSRADISDGKTITVSW